MRQRHVKKILLAGVVAAIAVTATAGPAQAATRKERALARQVKTLKAQAAKLKRERNAARAQLATTKATLTATQANLTTVTTERDTARSELSTVTIERDGARGELSTVTGERDAARSSLATCQRGVVPALSTMTPMQLSTDVLPTLVSVFEAWQGGIGAGQYTADASKSSTVSDGFRDQTYVFSVTQWSQ